MIQKWGKDLNKCFSEKKKKKDQKAQEKDVQHHYH